MKGKSLVVAILIITATLVSFLVWQQGSNQQLDVDNIGFFKQVDNQLVMQYGQHLWWLSEDKEVQHHLNLDSLNITAHGDYDFFSNGDLLVYHSTQPLSLLSNIAQFLRITKKTEINPVRKLGDDGFYRCQIESKQCLPFGVNLPVLDRSFRITIDKRNDALYLSDTSAHQLYKINEHGMILAKSLPGQFKFPNQISLIGDTLWVADTNHNRIISVNTHDEYFAQEIKSIDTTLSKFHRWPHQFSKLADSIWVNIADHSMSDGRLVEYDFSGKQVNQAVAKYITDPITMINWHNTLLIADFESANIEQFSLQGESLGLFTFSAFSELSNARQQQKASGAQLTFIGVVMFILTLIFGGVAAWILEKKESIALFKPKFEHPTDRLIIEAHSQYKDNEKPQSIFWIENKVLNNQKKHYLLGGLLLLPPFVIVFWGLKVIDLNEMFYVGALFFMILAAGYFSVIRYLASIKIGVQGDNFITEVNGSTSITAFTDLFYSATYIVTADRAVPLSNNQKLFFNKEQLFEHVYANLQLKNKLSRFSVLKYLWRFKESLFMVNVGFFIFATFAMFFNVLA